MSHDEEPKIIDAEFEEIIKDKVDTITDKVAEEIADEVKLNRKQRRTQASLERRVISLGRARNKYYHTLKQRTERRMAVNKKHEASHTRAVARKEAIKPTE